ncbi:hypothetical protein ACOYXV_00565 [Aeromonas veronii]
MITILSVVVTTISNKPPTLVKMFFSDHYKKTTQAGIEMARPASFDREQVLEVALNSFWKLASATLASPHSLTEWG